MIVEGTRWVEVRDDRLRVLAEGKLLRVVVRNRALAFVRMNGVLRAMDDRCPHQGHTLSGGWVDSGHVVCPFHRFHYDPTTGRCRHGLTGNVGIYGVQEEDRTVRVGFPYTTISLFGWRLW